LGLQHRGVTRVIANGFYLLLYSIALTLLSLSQLKLLNKQYGFRICTAVCVGAILVYIDGCQPAGKLENNDLSIA